MNRFALTVLSIATLAGCNAYGPAPLGAPAGAYASGGQCFYASNVIGFRKGPGDIIYVNTNARDYYELRTLSYCASRLNFEHRIALRSRAGNFVCSGHDAEIFIPDALGPTYCPVRASRKLSPPEVAALRASRR
jgi:hypothetical protein